MLKLESLPNRCATSKSLFIHLFIYSFFLFSNPFSLITSPELVQFLGACICPSTEYLPQLSICPSFYLSVCLSVCLSICPSVYLSVCLSARLSICPFVYLSVCLPSYLSVCLSIIYLFIYLSIYA